MNVNAGVYDTLRENREKASRQAAERVREQNRRRSVSENVQSREQAERAAEKQLASSSHLKAFMSPSKPITAWDSPAAAHAATAAL